MGYTKVRRIPTDHTQRPIAKRPPEENLILLLAEDVIRHAEEHFVTNSQVARRHLPLRREDQVVRCHGETAASRGTTSNFKLDEGVRSTVIEPANHLLRLNPAGFRVV